MFYNAYELQRSAFLPWSIWAQSNVNLLSFPYSALAYTPLTKAMAAGNELLLRITKRYDKPAFGLHETLIEGEKVAVSEAVVLKKPFCRLLHFARASERADPVVLLVAPLSGHHATLLRDTVRAMLPDHDVYITDWVDARLVPLREGPFHLDDYVAYVQEFIRLLGPELHVVAVCQPVVAVLAAVSLLAVAEPPASPRSMTLMGGPIDTRRGPTAVSALAKKRPLSWFKDNLIQRVPAQYPGFLRLVYPGFIQHAAFMAMNPERHLTAYRAFFDHLVEGDNDSAEAHRKFYDEYNAVLDLPAEFYLDTVETVFQQHALPRGEMLVRGVRVIPEAISGTALFTVEGELDDISGPGQTQAAHDLCRSIPISMRQHLVAEGVGHFGIFSGRRYREQIYPQIRDFIRQQS
jgi:poly(3-hydroxybutyrate) depolymerase